MTLPFILRAQVLEMTIDLPCPPLDLSILKDDLALEGQREMTEI
jgi:hypothetical protein